MCKGLINFRNRIMSQEDLEGSKRRNLTAEILSDRANISKSTLWSLETGKSNVSIESLLNVLSALGLKGELGKFNHKRRIRNPTKKNGAEQSFLGPFF